MFPELSKDSTSATIIGAIDQEIYEKLKLRLSENFIQANLTAEKAEMLKKDAKLNDF